MSTRAVPKRCVDALPEGDPLRSSLAAARRDRPDVDLERVYGSVIALASGVGGGGLEGGAALHGGASVEGGAGLAADATAGAAGTTVAAAGSRVVAVGAAKAGAGILAKSLVLGAFGVTSVGAAWWIASDRDPVYVEPPPARVAAAPPSVAPVPAPPPIVAEAPAAPVATATPSARPTASAASEEDPAAEMALLRDASGAISSDPSRALSLVDEAERRFARSSLGQEREMIRVQALIGAGRRDEALQRARALLARTPSSAHRPRLEQLLPELAQP